MRMDSPMGSQGTGGSRRSGQVSLADLCFLVLAAGLAAGVVRGAREVWGTGLSRWGSNGWSPTAHFERTAGLAVEVASIWLALILARGILRLVRGPRSGGGPGRVGLLGMMGWRVPAIALLLGFTMRESQVLGVDLAKYRALGAGQGEIYPMSVMLVPICAILTIIGVALGMGAGMSLPRGSPARARPYWLFVPLAALAAVLFMGQPGGECTLIPQFILVVLDYVIYAMPPPGVRLPGSLAVRLLRAGIEAVPAALACLCLALVIAHDFERARRDQPWAMGRGGWILRILSLVVALAAGTVVVGVAIPTMHPCLLDGFRGILDTESIAMVLGGFGVLAAGLAARALVPPPSHEAPRRLRRLSCLLAAGMIVIILLSAMQAVPSSMQIDPAVPAIVGRVCDFIRDLSDWLFSMFPDSIETDLSAWLSPRRLAWPLLTTILALFLIELSGSRTGGSQPAPFDAVAESPARLARFFWLVASLTTVCLVAVPTLMVLGQALAHIRYRINDWTTLGWPSPF
jgi:hypothetical protein